MPLIATVPEVFVATMTIFLSYYYDALEETLTHINVADFYAEILVYAEGLYSAGAFKHEHLGYITRIFEDTSDSKFRLWDIQKYKQVTYFIKKISVCDMDVISQEDIIAYESLVQEATR